MLLFDLIVQLATTFFIVQMTLSQVASFVDILYNYHHFDLSVFDFTHAFFRTLFYNLKSAIQRYRATQGGYVEPHISQIKS